jgi:hypothetical protein
MKADGNRAIVSQEKILEAISRAQQSRELLKRNVNARLLLKICFCLSQPRIHETFCRPRRRSLGFIF